MRASLTTSRLSAAATGIALAVLAAAIGACGGGSGGGRRSTATPIASATPVPTQAAGAGLSAAIVAAAVGDDGRLLVELTLTDAGGVPLTATLSTAQEPQQARVRLTAAQLEQYAGGDTETGNSFYRYVNQINRTTPAYDRNGTLTLLDAATGRYRYAFATALPAGFDRAATFSVGMQVDRSVAGQQLSANPVFDFVPAGGAPQVWSDTTTAQCNACHQPLIAHGNRREVRLCKLCHTEAAADAKGTSIDFRTMVHKIHAGKELPSVAAGPPGARYAIFSSFAQEDVVFAEKQADGTVTGVGFPRALQSCAACHADGPTAAFANEKPAAAACATCHDDVNPSLQPTDAGPPGTNHRPGSYADGQCNGCHAATANAELDISVPGAHVVPARSSKLEGLHVTITGLADHAAGQTPTISFRVSNDAGTPLRDLTGLNRLAFALGGPTTDYGTVLTPTAVGGGAAGRLAGPDADGVFQYTLPAPLPADAGGTWALGAEARRTVQLTSSVSIDEAAPNPVVTFTLDDATALPHRAIVAADNCGTCHGELSKDFSVHGNLRNQIEYCEICHNSTQSDAARRRRDPDAVAAGALNAPIDLKVMLHKIHRGEALAQQPYVIYGFGAPPQNYTPHDFGDVRFPGDLRICETCHVDDSQLLPPYPGPALPTLLTALDPATGNPVPADPDHLAAITAVCTSCHDDDGALAHVATQTAPDGSEACTVCHAEGRSVAVSAAHAARN